MNQTLFNYISFGDVNLLCSSLIPIIAGAIYSWSKLIYEKNLLVPRLILVLSVIQTIHLWMALCCLGAAFVLSNFDLKITSFNSQQSLSLWYKIAAVWSNHAGSMLLWITMTATAHLIFLIQTHRQFAKIYQCASMIQLLWVGVLSASLFWTTNPFDLMTHNLSDGLGLSPLLHDPAMLIHPPSLYCGLIGFTVPFALALSIYINRCQNNIIYFQLLRVWITGGFGLLTIGITLGSLWAYYELGWGGYWYWDPIETISLIPWLIALMILHYFSNATQHTVRIINKTLLLYTTIIFGTYSSRSGIVASIHAFAYDPYNGLVFLVLGIICFILWAIHCFKVAPNTKHKVMLNSVTLTNLIQWQRWIILTYCTLLIVSLVGPVAVSIILKQNVAVKTYFYEVITLIIVSAILSVLMYLRIDYSKNKYSYKVNVLNHLAVYFLPILMINYIVALWMGSIIKPVMHILLGGGLIVALQSLYHIVQKKWELGFAHLSFVMILNGVIINYMYSSHHEIVMKPYQNYLFNGLVLKLVTVKTTVTELYMREQATLLISPIAGGAAKIIMPKSFILRPEKRLYTANNILTSKTAIGQHGLSHYYVALGGAYPDGSRAVFLAYYPLIGLIWIGGMVLGVVTLIKAITLNRAGRRQKF